MQEISLPENSTKSHDYLRNKNYGYRAPAGPFGYNTYYIRPLVYRDFILQNRTKVDATF